ncbi:hypothetical protein RchiOBHm_Chr4g0437481 [Rosa chinensis]|uniref:Cytochrome P450 n=1 Tax=Rosa chinensis TaxID=74649 RepID=A0A2P6R2B3_ROSCH|nr:hypothetical protein RchiOBHm_Chr4g0437481 [Rosa chinensis]
MKLSVFLVKNSFTIRFPGLSKNVKTNDEIESEKIEKGIRNSLIEIIKKREKKALMSREDESFGNDFLGLLLRAHHDTNDKEHFNGWFS